MDQFTWQWASAPAPPSGGSALGGEQDTVFSPPQTPSCGFPLGSGLTFSTSWGLDVFLLEKKSQTGGSLGNLPALETSSLGNEMASLLGDESSWSTHSPKSRGEDSALRLEECPHRLPVWAELLGQTV